ncbi:ATP-dependent RNA helicase HrpA [Schlesneria paludicola]|uniref:ATP-dependent RNA helicase HrpA n=1 Tax=Schlesneria paludicola TaxID=360056 RepID=UPI00029B0E7D|nr:ATP-dependent RNA helicase HrpA [Schlesneria paludicola]
MTDLITEIEASLTKTMLVDRHRLRQQWRSLREPVRRYAAGEPPTATPQQNVFDQRLAKFQADLANSCRRSEQRLRGVPKLNFDEELPVVVRKDEIAAAIRDHQVIVVCGETGSGKSTQLPKICLELGRGIHGVIGHTQPRRIAARSVATRIAEELNVAVGREVGFKVRFTDATSPQTYIKLMTDGILLAETQSRPFLDEYDTIIVDEAHERSLNIDFLLGNLHRLISKRRELKVIITSATIDAERFAEHFRSVAGNVPVLEVSGRMYPVEMIYRPPSPDDEGGDPDWMKAVGDAVNEVCARGPGDVLLFMPTEREIHEAAKTLRGRTFGGSKPDILPLYARLSAAEQQRVFQTSSTRRIVIATNVAESSLTVPGIRYVVDTGTARISRYSPKSKLQRLPIEPVSQASADQRAGRCGRVGPGVCIRLYSEEDYTSRERYTPPEILRSNLANVILQTKTLGLGEIEEFPFLEPPKPESIKDGYKTLFELGAVTEQHALTEMGRKLSRLPVDPRIARIIWAAHEENCLGEILIIASALEVQDPRERPLEKQQQADESHKRFADEDSDFLSDLKLWDFYHKLKNELSKGQLRKACHQNFLSWIRLREWVDVHAELVSIVQESLKGTRVGGNDRRRQNANPQNTSASITQADATRQKPTAERAVVDTTLTRRNDFGAIHRALLTGYLSSLAYRTESGEYLAAGNMKAFLWPGSGLASKKPKWVVAAELLETTRRFLRTVAKIDPDWIEPLAAHLIDRTYSEPHWDPESLAVMAYEKVSLFGLVVVPRRRIRFSQIDPVKSREMFIQHALVYGEWPEDDVTSDVQIGQRDKQRSAPGSKSSSSRDRNDHRKPIAIPAARPAVLNTKSQSSSPEFLTHNRDLIKSLEDLQTRVRRGSLLKEEQAQFDFYATRLPADVLDGHRLQQWWRAAAPDDRKRLYMTEADLVEADAILATKDAYPDSVQMKGLSLPLSYRLDPSAEDDGVTITVPQEGLNQLDGDRLGWLVPGLIEDKITALIRTLPKELRRDLVPIPEVAAEVAKVLNFGDGSLAAAIVEGIEFVTGIEVPPHAFDETKITDHLRMLIRVTDSDGKTLAAGRDLAVIRKEFGAMASISFSSSDDPRWTRDGLATWDCGTLPPVIDVMRRGVALKGYPTLIDQGETASLRLLDNPERSQFEMRFGLRRLIVLTVARELKVQIDALPGLQNWTLLSKTFPQPFPFRAQLTELLADRAFLPTTQFPRSDNEFRECLRAGRTRLPSAAVEVTSLLTPLFQAYSDVRKTWEKTAHPQWQPSRQDVHAQLSHLFSPGFLVRTPWPWLTQFPRYTRAIVLRLQKLTSGGAPRDQQLLPLIIPRWQRGIERLRLHADRQIYDPELEAYRWMTEELRVALFVQELGTAVSVSEKKLDKQWERVKS